jgi:uncharacterized membrane protein HdeD (DUF308 family)
MKLLYRRSILIFGASAIVLGLAIFARTVYEGGGIGILLGILFVAVGAGRIYLLRRR